VQLVEDPPDARAADMDIMVAFKIDHDFPGPKMICLPQIYDFDENLGLSCPGAMDGPARTI
jgi:hypothetical protein